MIGRVPRFETRKRDDSTPSVKACEPSNQRPISGHSAAPGVASPISTARATAATRSSVLTRRKAFGIFSQELKTPHPTSGGGATRGVGDGVTVVARITPATPGGGPREPQPAEPAQPRWPRRRRGRCRHFRSTAPVRGRSPRRRKGPGGARAILAWRGRGPSGGGG